MTRGKPIRVAVIGTGFMGKVHLRAARNSGANVVALVGRTHQAAAQLADAESVDGHFDSIDDLIREVEFDVAHVCTPNGMHVSQVQQLLAAGVHVICEKPLATTKQDAVALAALANANGTVHAVPFVYRFYASIREIRERVKHGDAGRLTLIHGHYLQDWLLADTTTNWRVDPRSGGASRAFADIGIHWCDLAEFASGDRIIRLTARTAITISDRSDTTVANEDIALLLFETAAGAVGSLTTSQVSPGRRNQLELSLDGSARAYSFQQEHPDQLWLGEPDSVTIFDRRLPPAPSVTSRYSLLPAGHPQGYQDAFNSFVSDVYSAVKGDVVDGLPTFDDGARAAVLTHAVLLSASTSSWVDVPVNEST